MDEPLSNLDAQLRTSMRAELSRMRERLAVTTIYVTHDQIEAMTLGERVAVMRAGAIQQCDTPRRLFDQPTNCRSKVASGFRTWSHRHSSWVCGPAIWQSVGEPLRLGVDTAHLHFFDPQSGNAMT